MQALEDDIQLDEELRKRNVFRRQMAITAAAAPSGLATNSVFFCFLIVKKSFICLEDKSMTPCRGITVLFRSSQQLPRLRLGPLKDFLS